MENKKILAINPGSTSTKVGVFGGNELLLELTLRHTAEELAAYPDILSQFGFRKNIIINALHEAEIDIYSLAAVIGRGGLLKPISSGVYEVNDSMKADLRSGCYGSHASNLGGLIAADIAAQASIKAYIADPVVVDELQDVARISGLPQLERISIFHALNQKAIAGAYAEQQGRSYEDMNLVVAHMGGGVSVGAHRCGEVVDVNNALDGDGPFSSERAGSLPAGQLAALCFDGEHTHTQVKKMLTGKGGLVAHLGVNDLRDAIAMQDRGDAHAGLIVDAMCYTIGKEIGAMATVLSGKVDAIILTGGMAHSNRVCNYIEEMTGFIAPVIRMPGENELEALALNALRVLQGKVTAKVY